MVRGIWNKESMNQDIKAEIIKESNRQQESCLYTSTSLYIWLRRKRLYENWLVIVPVVCGILASASLLNDNKLLTGSLTILASISPAIYKALKLGEYIDSLSREASVYKNLQDEFRQIAQIHSNESIEVLKDVFNKAMDKMNKARETSITPPEWCFKKAQKKIKQSKNRWLIV